MNPFLQAVLRIAQGHYGGRPKTAWLQRMAQQPDMQTAIGQRLMQNLSMGTPQQIQGMTPGHIGNLYS